MCRLHLCLVCARRYDDAWIDLALFLERTHQTQGSPPGGVTEGAVVPADLREQVKLLVEKVRLQLELVPGPG